MDNIVKLKPNEKKLYEKLNKNVQILKNEQVAKILDMKGACKSYQY